MPLRREIATLDRAARRGGGARAVRPDRRPDGARHGWLARCAAAQRRLRRRRRPPCRPPACRCCTSRAPARGSSPEAVTGAPYVVLEYCDRMDLAYAAADLVVARSGANTVCELTAVGLPAVYVPLPIGNGEQRLNAAAVVAAGGGLLVDDADVTPAWVGDVVRPLALDEARLATMAAAAASVGERGGDELLADLVVAAAAEGSDAVSRRPARATTSPPRCRPSSCSAGCTSSRSAAPACRPSPGSCSPAALPVSGSDAADSPTLEALRDSGARVDVGHDAAHVDRRRHRGGVVRRPRRQRRARRRPGRRAAGAAPLPGPGLAHGRRRGASRWPAPTARRRRRRCSSSALVAAGADPSFAFGGEIAQLGTNAALGGGPAFVVEADESDGSFLAYRPDVAVVTNVQPDHLDFYGTTEAVEEAYADVRRLRHRRRARSSRAPTTPARGASPTRRGPRAARSSPTATAPGADLRVGATTLDGPRHPVGASSHAGVERALDLAVPGEHNVMDACAAYLAAVVGLGADPEAVLAGLAGFGGARRRFEVRGEVGGVTVVDDYAHNPAKVAAVVGTAADARAPGRARVAARGLPAAPVLPHPRLRRRSSPRRWHRPTRSCCSTSTARASSRSRASPRRWSATRCGRCPASARCSSGPPARRPSRRWSAPPQPGDLVLDRRAPATSPPSPRSSSRPCAPAPEGRPR